HSRHRIVPVRPRVGAPESATVVGPVCESADVFDPESQLPPLERGDVVAVLDAGALGAGMSSTYKGRGRLPRRGGGRGQAARPRAVRRGAGILAGARRGRCARALRSGAIGRSTPP